MTTESYTKIQLKVDDGSSDTEIGEPDKAAAEKNLSSFLKGVIPSSLTSISQTGYKKVFYDLRMRTTARTARMQS
jgi:hypothetical protein